MSPKKQTSPVSATKTKEGTMTVKLEEQGEKVLTEQESCYSVSDHAEDEIGISYEVEKIIIII